GNRLPADGAARGGAPCLDGDDPDPHPPESRLKRPAPPGERPEVVDQEVPWAEVHALTDPCQVFQGHVGHAGATKPDGDLPGQGLQGVQQAQPAPTVQPSHRPGGAEPMLGQAGFTLIAVAALLSTTSAINATLYGSARLSFIIAKDGELPATLERPIWHKPLEGLFITAALTLVIANTLDLSSISTIGSAGFLIIF
ncbi:MAG: hypothetical protein M1423_00265, partial [Acidobacteria bacterium]|nr:hypothetical protein [Acidobacteriota bacterium]